MKKYLFLSFAVLLAFSLASACKNDEHANQATIDIISPTEGQIFHPGETVPIKAMLTGEELLHGWKVELRKKAGNSVLFNAGLHTHGLTFSIDESWTNNLTEHTDLVLEVFAQIDHDGTLTSKIVNFHAHPM